MSAIDTLIVQISHPRLHERLSAEWGNTKKEKKFRLVFEDQLPEMLPLHGAKPRKGDLVCHRKGALKDVWQVKQVRKSVAICVRPSSEIHPSEPNRTAAEAMEFSLDELLWEGEFPEAYRQQVTIVINQKGVAQGRLSRAEEYALFCFNPGVNDNFEKSVGLAKFAEKHGALLGRIPLIRKQSSAGGEHFARLEINQAATVKKLLLITSNPQFDELFASAAI